MKKKELRSKILERFPLLKIKKGETPRFSNGFSHDDKVSDLREDVAEDNDAAAQMAGHEGTWCCHQIMRMAEAAELLGFYDPDKPADQMTAEDEETQEAVEEMENDPKEEYVIVPPGTKNPNEFMEAEFVTLYRTKK